MRVLGGIWLAQVSLAATIQGVAVDSTSGKLLAFTKVTLAAVSGASSFTTQTGRAGRFAFSNVPDGAYFLKGERPGFVRARYHTRIVVKADGFFHADLRLRRAGAIQGTVFDENQVGLAGHNVTAFRAARPMRQAASANTDDRGFYRIAGLAPGKYYVRTAARSYPDGENLLPTFFGQGTATAQARVIDLDAAPEAADINVQPLYGKLCRLSGSVTPAGAVTAKLMGDTGVALEQSSAAGGFAFDQLTPGNYELLLESGGFSGHRTIELGADLDGVTVELSRPPPLKFAFVETSGKPAEAAQISVLAKRDGETRRAWPDGAPLPAGVWELAVICGSEYYVASIRGDAQPNARWNEILVSADRDNLVTVTLSPRPGSVRGIVKAGGLAAPGASVLLDSADPERPIPIQKAIAGERGEYHFRGLAPGRYRLAAANDPERVELSSLESLDAVIVAVEEAVEATKDVEAP